MITEGHLARHYAGRRGGRDPALLDIAQDHALALLDAEGIFELGVALKGGTALRKFRAGNQGRFSTDLDFAGAGEIEAELILATLDGSGSGGFTFRVERLNEHRRSMLHVDSDLGAPQIPARIDCSPKTPWLAPEILRPIPLPIHASYDLDLPAIPTMRVEEVLSEKLARYRRASLARDLYDLAWFARGSPFDEPLVRRLTALKVWHDVVDDGLGKRPFRPDDILNPRRPKDFDEEAIGYLTTPVDIEGWIVQVCTRFTFLEGLDDDEALAARCSAGDRHAVSELVAAL